MTITPAKAVTGAASFVAAVGLLWGWNAGAVDHFSLGPRVAANSQAVDKLTDYVEHQIWLRDFEVCLATRERSTQAAEICQGVADDKQEKRRRDLEKDD